MPTNMKGLFKGIKHISQIFVYKEQEMEIGYPTDVKHVAHIGWDGSSRSTPSWMNEFKSASDFSTTTLNNFGQSGDQSCVTVTQCSSPDSQQHVGLTQTTGIFLDSHPPENPPKKLKRKKPKCSTSAEKAKRSSSNTSSPSSSRHKLKASSTVNQEELNAVY